MKTFVPLDDVHLYEHPEQLPAQLVPYQVGLPCVHGQVSERATVPAPVGATVRQVRHED